MITITIEEADKDGQVLARHAASAPIDTRDAKGVAALIAKSVGGLMYHGEVKAEVPLLLAAAGTHHASSCTRAIGHAIGLAGSSLSFDLAVKATVDVDRLLDFRASKRDRETTAQMLRAIGANVRRREEND